MRLAPVLFFFIALKISALTCGGNCAGNCPDCPCGSNKSVRNSTWISDKCHSEFYSSQSCCKCIISAASSSNAHFTSFS